jgi:hypothetical protein
VSVVLFHRVAVIVHGQLGVLDQCLLAAVLAVGSIWWQRKTKILDWDLTADEPIVGAAAAQQTMSRLKVQYEGVSLRYPRLIRPSATATTALSPPPIGS